MLAQDPRDPQTCAGIKFIGKVGTGALQVSDGTHSAKMDVEVVGVDRITVIDMSVGEFSQR